MILWTIFAVLTAAALIAVLWPLLRMGRLDVDPAAYDSAVFKDQLQELASEEDRGVISSDEAEAARTEVSRRLLAAARIEADISSKMPTWHGNISTLAVVCAFICVPVASAALYLIYGSPEMPDRPLVARLDPHINSQKVETLVANVEARLRQNPEDGRGWEVLAPVYMRQQRFGDAANAFGKTIRLLGDTPERLTNFGHALVMANYGVVTEPARQAFQNAVEKDATLVRAFFWLAVAQEQDGNLEQAATAWRALLKRGSADAPWRRKVQQRLSDLELQLGTGAPGKVGESSSRAIAKGPTREQIEASKDLSQSDRSAMIAQMVARLAARLRSEGGSIEEWGKLVRSYAFLGDKEAAAKAIADARKALAQDKQATSSLIGMAKQFGLSSRLEQLKGIGSPGTTAEGTNGNAVKGPNRKQIEASKDLNQSERSAMIAQMVAGLSERLRSDGGSVEEWKQLIRSYAVLGDKEAAAKAVVDARKALAQDQQAIVSLNEIARELGF